MIRTEQGRSFSVRTAEELETQIAADMQRLTPDEREALQAVLSEISSQSAKPAESTLFGAIGKLEYKTTPVDMKTFVKDPYYLGNTCDTIYPVLLKDLEEMFSGGYQEIIIGGAIGIGKTFSASIGICRVLYELSCMVDPYRSFGLGPDSGIAIVCFSVNEMLAVKVVFEGIATKLKASPYFEKHFPFKDTKKELRFPNGIWVAARASTDTSAIGLNVIASFQDEGNFLQKSEKETKAGVVDRAETIYNLLKRRMKSRFGTAGRTPGKMFVISSKNTLDDFTERRIREAKDDPTVFVREYSLWGVRPEIYSGDAQFWVLCGNESTPSKILTDAEYEEQKDNVPEGVRFIQVPEDFRNEFSRDIEGSLRDLGGVASVSVNPFIHRREKILEAIDKNRIHPFTTEVYDRSQGGTFRWGLMIQQTVERGYGEVPVPVSRPIINPRAARHIHIDPALRNDSMGFCMAHIGGWKDVPRRAEDGKEYSERAPIYIVDVMLRIVPPIGDEIVLADMRHLIYELSSHGYMITGITLDSWQSSDSLQQFNQRGFNAWMLSVDTSTAPYENLKMALYENRVSMYEYAPIIEELQQIERRYDGRKVKIDHPPKKSKDCSDALAAACFALSANNSVHPLPPVKGVTASGDPWMEEQRQSVLAGRTDAGMNSVVLPPFLTGGNSSGGNDDGWM